VLDLTTVLAGPYCTLLLADAGAEVIKVERPGTGDATRSWGPPFLDQAGGVSAYFASINRGKRSVAIDIQAEPGRRMVAGLVKAADVVIDNFRPGVMKRLHLDHDTLKAISPSVVSCSITGYGASSRYADRPGAEVIVEGMSGMMSITGTPDGGPVRLGSAMIDIATGLTAAGRILASLYRRSTTGVGARIECSLYETALSALGTTITTYTASGNAPQKLGTHHAGICPYGAFRTSDGYALMGVFNDERWPTFCHVLGLSSLATDDRLCTNAGRLRQRSYVHSSIEQMTSPKRTADIVGALEGAGLMAAPVRSVPEMWRDPDTAELGLFVELQQYRGVFSPLLDRAARGDEGCARVPTLGEDTAAVLARDCGMSDPEVARWRGAGVIG
jgi:formyl-CoA transferase/CoA:oxalate CoA-transferase